MRRRRGSSALLLLLLQGCSSSRKAAAAGQTVPGTLAACSLASNPGAALSVTTCANKLTVDLTARNGQNETSPQQWSVHAVSDCRASSSSSGAPCPTTTLQNDLTITLTRTPVYFKYPTAYENTVNFQKYELTVSAPIHAAAADADALGCAPHVARPVVTHRRQ
jgi:hypothetical protein